MATETVGNDLIRLKVTDMHKPVYQRDVDQSWVERHARVFDAALLQVPDVSYRDGKWWVVDGLHRRDLVRKVEGDDAEMVCKPHYGHDEQSEWRAFRSLNRDRRRLTGLEEFKSALALHEPTEVSINRIVTEAGYTVGSGKSPSRIGAVTVLYDIYRSGREERLRRALNVYAGAYGGSSSGKVVSVVLDAIGIVLRYYGEQDITDERLIRKLSAAGNARQLMGMSRGTGSGHGNVNVANAIIEVWNKGLREYNKLPLLVSKAR